MFRSIVIASLIAPYVLMPKKHRVILMTTASSLISTEGVTSSISPKMLMVDSHHCVTEDGLVRDLWNRSNAYEVNLTEHGEHMMWWNNLPFCNVVATPDSDEQTDISFARCSLYGLRWKASLYGSIIPVRSRTSLDGPFTIIVDDQQGLAVRSMIVVIMLVVNTANFYKYVFHKI